MSHTFFTLSARIGARTPFWVQGAGGNISEKMHIDGKNILRIKASGYRLDHVNSEQGFVDLDLNQMQSQLQALRGEDQGEELYAQLLATGVVARAKSGDRASMETGFHLAVHRPLVAHFHSLVGLVFADLYFKGDSRVSAFVSSLPRTCRFLDYVKPGLDLSFAIQDAEEADIYFLKNHGVILAMNEIADLDAWQSIEDAIVQAFGWHALRDDVGLTKNYWPLAALMPDTIVFMERLLKVLEKDPHRPGYFRWDSDAVADPNLSELWQANIRILAARPDVDCIPDREWEALSGMPVETYRRSMQISAEGP